MKCPVVSVTSPSGQERLLYHSLLWCLGELLVPHDSFMMIEMTLEDEAKGTFLK